MPGSVVVAPTTGLRAQGIRYVFHAAIVQGEIERGYYALEDSISDAVHNAFARLSDTPAAPPLSSILFPVFGGGAGRLGPDLAATRLVNSIKNAVPATPQAKRVYLLAYVESHRVALRRAAEAAKLEPVGNRRRATRSS